MTRDLFQTIDTGQSRPLILRQGEMFFAQVNKIYPNQHAEIQLGRHKLVARLEAPLEVGKGYYLQVESAEGEPRLKLIGSKQADSFSLMRQLALPNEKGFHALAEYFTKETLSLTREQLQRAGQWVGAAADKNLALEVVKLMSSRNLPFSENIFHSLLAASSKLSLSDAISSLRSALVSENKTDPIVQKILALIDTLGKDEGQKGANHNLYMQAGKEGSKKGIAMEPGGLHGKDSHQARTNTDPHALTGREASLKKLKMEIGGLPELRMQEKGTAADQKTMPGKEAIAKIKNSIRQMGLFNEHAILHQRAMNEGESLKSLLIQLLDRPNTKLNSIARQSAEHLLNRMNGQQLLSIDAGPVQQLFFELPIELHGHRTDLTFQWEGKRREDGKIDPDYCRIIFYLDLENLDKTVVDVKIQNRITNITVINETLEIKTIAEMMIPELKEKLKEHDYELSAVHFKQPVLQKGKRLPKMGTQPYSGVDIQI